MKIKQIHLNVRTSFWLDLVNATSEWQGSRSRSMSSICSYALNELYYDLTSGTTPSLPTPPATNTSVCLPRGHKHVQVYTEDSEDMTKWSYVTERLGTSYAGALNVALSNLKTYLDMPLES